MRIKKRERLQAADAHLNCEKKLETGAYSQRYIKAVILTKKSIERLSLRVREVDKNDDKIIGCVYALFLMIGIIGG